MELIPLFDGQRATGAMAITPYDRYMKVLNKGDSSKHAGNEISELSPHEREARKIARAARAAAIEAAKQELETKMMIEEASKAAEAVKAAGRSTAACSLRRKKKSSSSTATATTKRKKKSVPISAMAGPPAPPVPRILFQTWKTREVPERWRDAQASVVHAHPHWEYRLLTDEDNDRLVAEHFPEFLARFRGFRYPIQRADAIRYVVLYVFGGVYLDLDYVCVRPLDGVLESMPADRSVGLLASANPGAVTTNSMIVARPGSPFFLECIRRMQRPRPFWACTRHVEGEVQEEQEHDGVVAGGAAGRCPCRGGGEGQGDQHVEDPPRDGVFDGGDGRLLEALEVATTPRLASPWYLLCLPGSSPPSLLAHDGAGGVAIAPIEVVWALAGAGRASMEPVLVASMESYATGKELLTVQSFANYFSRAYASPSNRYDPRGDREAAAAKGLGRLMMRATLDEFAGDGTAVLEFASVAAAAVPHLEAAYGLVPAFRASSSAWAARRTSPPRPAAGCGCPCPAPATAAGAGVVPLAAAAVRRAAAAEEEAVALLLAKSPSPYDRADPVLCERIRALELLSRGERHEAVRIVRDHCGWRPLGPNVRMVTEGLLFSIERGAGRDLGFAAAFREQRDEISAAADEMARSLAAVPLACGGDPAGTCPAPALLLHAVQTCNLAREWAERGEAEALLRLEAAETAVMRLAGAAFQPCARPACGAHVPLFHYERYYFPCGMHFLCAACHRKGLEERRGVRRGDAWECPQCPPGMGGGPGAGGCCWSRPPQRIVLEP
eukprot:tig00000681_g3144.t1